MEWPTNNQYWGFASVNEFVSEYELDKTRFHGCALGLKNAAGLPVKKPWTIATNDDEVYFEMLKYQCPGSGCHPTHAQCNAQTAADSANYTDDMVIAASLPRQS